MTYINIPLHALRSLTSDRVEKAREQQLDITLNILLALDDNETFRRQLLAAMNEVITISHDNNNHGMTKDKTTGPKTAELQGNLKARRTALLKFYDEFYRSKGLPVEDANKKCRRTALAAAAMIICSTGYLVSTTSPSSAAVSVLTGAAAVGVLWKAHRGKITAIEKDKRKGERLKAIHATVREINNRLALTSFKTSRESPRLADVIYGARAQNARFKQIMFG